MNLADRLVAWFAPVAAVHRASARLGLARLYDAATTSPRHKIPTDRRSGDGVVDHATWKPTAWARHLEQNVDLVAGLLDSLAHQASSVDIEPQILTASGELHERANEQLAAAWLDHRDHLEVTGTYSWAELAPLLARSWLRDGEVLVHHLERSPLVGTYQAPFEYQIQALEADYLPWELTHRDRNLVHGVEKDTLGRPVAYHLYKNHPGDALTGFAVNLQTRDLMTIPARNMNHLRLVKRLGQTRGVSVLAPVIRRVDDLRDYEESERIAARLAASICGFITRGAGVTPTVSVDTTTKERSFNMQAGIIFDDMLPGESVELLNPSRPNANAADWRATQLRAVAAGSGASYSTIARDYSGSYSSQRQELVEQTFSIRRRLQAPLIANVLRPIWERFARVATQSGAVSLAGADPATLTRATFAGLQVPWIDPLKETQAEELAVTAGFKARHQVIREHGGNPREVDKERGRDPEQAKRDAMAEQIAAGSPDDEEEDADQAAA